jgi:thiamine biosynthesis protein ThiI
MTERLIITSSSEIVLKSPTVRRFMENRLRRQVRDALRRKGIRHVYITKGGGRTYVCCSDPEAALQLILRIPGIDFASIAFRTEPDISLMCNAATECLAASLSVGQSFAVRAKVVDNKALSKKEIEIRVGQAILDRLADKALRVNLDSPDKTAYVEVRGADAFVYSDIRDGSGGLPVGTQGKMLGIFSDVALSAVASWMMLRRGALIIPVCLEAQRDQSSVPLATIANSLSRFREWVPVPRLVALILRTEGVLRRINEMTTENVSKLVYLGSILRALDAIATEEGALGVVVANRTMLDPAIISRCRTPIYQPLIGLDERELEKYISILGIGPGQVHEPHGLLAECAEKVPDLALLLDDRELQDEVMSMAKNRETLIL